jgi:hypothetical protein
MARPALRILTSPEEVPEGSRPGGRQAETLVPVLERFSQAVTTRAAMPASAALPQARGS